MYLSDKKEKIKKRLLEAGYMKRDTVTQAKTAGYYSGC
jgi:hypothetical protein